MSSFNSGVRDTSLSCHNDQVNIICFFFLTLLDRITNMYALYSKGGSLRDATVLEHSFFKCFQDREQIKLYFVLYSTENSIQGSISYFTYLS